MVILFSCFAANAQFQVTVRLTGDCIYPDQNTYYVVIVRVYNTVTNQFYDPAYSVTQTTNYQSPVDITVQLDDFCTADNTQIYRIFVDARKIYADQREICSGNNSSSITIL